VSGSFQRSISKNWRAPWRFLFLPSSPQCTGLNYSICTAKQVRMSSFHVRLYRSISARSVWRSPDCSHGRWPCPASLSAHSTGYHWRKNASVALHCFLFIRARSRLPVTRAARSGQDPLPFRRTWRVSSHWGRSVWRITSFSSPRAHPKSWAASSISFPAGWVRQGKAASREMTNRSQIWFGGLWRSTLSPTISCARPHGTDQTKSDSYPAHKRRQANRKDTAGYLYKKGMFYWRN